MLCLTIPHSLRNDAQGAILLPPGICSAEQLASSVNLDRLPVGMRNFLAKQYGIGETAADEQPAESGRHEREDSEKEKPVKRQKIKHFPRPPPGPPPPSALQSVKAADE